MQTKTVYIINDENQIEEIDYLDHVLNWRDETTTPQGVGPVHHMRESKWFKVSDGDPWFDKFFETEEEAQDAVEGFAETHNETLTMQPVTRYEIWRWGPSGNYPKRLDHLIFDDEAEAAEKLMAIWEEEATIDNEVAPQLFYTREDAEAQLKMLAEETEETE